MFSNSYKNIKKITSSTTAVVLIVITAAVTMIFFSSFQISSSIKQKLIEQAIIVTNSFDTENFYALKGIPEDKNTSEYQILKKQLIQLKQSVPNCHYLYILEKNMMKLFF